MGVATATATAVVGISAVAAGTITLAALYGMYQAGLIDKKVFDDTARWMEETGRAGVDYLTDMTRHPQPDTRTYSLEEIYSAPEFTAYAEAIGPAWMSQAANLTRAQRKASALSKAKALSKAAKSQTSQVEAAPGGTPDPNDEKGRKQEPKEPTKFASVEGKILKGLHRVVRAAPFITLGTGGLAYQHFERSPNIQHRNEWRKFATQIGIPFEDAVGIFSGEKVQPEQIVSLANSLEKNMDNITMPEMRRHFEQVALNQGLNSQQAKIAAENFLKDETAAREQYVQDLKGFLNSTAPAIRDTRGLLPSNLLSPYNRWDKLNVDYFDEARDINADITKVRAKFVPQDVPTDKLQQRASFAQEVGKRVSTFEKQYGTGLLTKGASTSVDSLAGFLGVIPSEIKRREYEEEIRKRREEKRRIARQQFNQ